MKTFDDRDWMRVATDAARRHLDSLPTRPVRAAAGRSELLAELGGPLPDSGEDAATVVGQLARGADPGLIATAGPRFFGFVIGGSLPATVGADWLTSVWDQNAGLFTTSPAASVAEEVAAGWLRDLLGLPAGASCGFVTGGQMANFVGLAVARHAVLERAGWHVEEDGLQGAPAVHVVIGDEAHATVLQSLRYLGLGSRRAVRVPTDGQGRLVGHALRDVLSRLEGPTIVCAQAGNVNTGAFDPFPEVVRAARERGAWVHVDGAFGLWAHAAPARRHLVEGVDGADSWAVDGHKWLNVPYDSGFVFTAHPEAHRAAMIASAPYLQQRQGEERDPFEWAPEFSRRARGFTAWAALRSLGRSGVAAMVERSCMLATRIAERLRASDGVSILNEVVLNQALVRFAGPGGDDDFTRAVIARVQRDGTCWLSGTRWHGVEAMRVSVSNWSTTEADADASADAILAARDAVRAEREGR